MLLCLPKQGSLSGSGKKPMMKTNLLSYLGGGFTYTNGRNTVVWNTYGDYLEGSGWTSILTLHKTKNMINKSPTFQYWDTVLHMEITGLIFVRAHREQNFPPYVETLKALVPCFFALDHHNYAR